MIAVCLAPVSLLSDCFLTWASCTPGHGPVAGRVLLVGPLVLFTTISLSRKAKPCQRSLKPEVSPAFEGRILSQLLSSLGDLKKLSTLFVCLRCNAFNHPSNSVLMQNQQRLRKSDQPRGSLLKISKGLTGFKDVL